MSWKIVLSSIFILLVIGLLFVYWFDPFKISNFEIDRGKNSNFSLFPEGKIQFYPDMRYPESEISYKIYDCPIKKRNNMLDAFNIISNKTIIKFYPVNDNEEISITCESREVLEQGLFIAGEGGPVNITKTGRFNVINNGKVLLLREAECDEPLVEIHEVMHALGFDHSENKNNIMYNISICGQTIGEDSIELINKIYSYPSSPDLSFVDVSATLHGMYFDSSMSVRNDGLKKSKNAALEIYANGNKIYETKLDELEVGYGRVMKLKDLFITQRNVKDVEFVINYPYEELDKENNKAVLKLK